MSFATRTFNFGSPQMRGLRFVFPLWEGNGRLLESPMSPFRGQWKAFSGTFGGRWHRLAGTPLTAYWHTFSQSDYIETLDAPHPTEYTICMWVYPTFTEIDPDGQSYLARTTSAGTGSAYSHQIGTIFSGGSKFISHTFDGATRTVIGTTPANEGAIYHVAGTAKNGDVVRLYVNGKEEGTPLSVGTLWTGGDRWWIASVRATGHWYQGLMWDVRLYDRVLSAPEIYALYDPATREDLYTVPQRLLASTGITIVPVSQDFSPVYEALHGTISSDQLMSFEATQFLAQSRVIPYEAASGTVSGERDVSFEAQGFSTRSEASPYEALGGVTEVARTHTLSYEALAAAIARTYVIPWEAREVQVALTAPLGITAATVWTGGARDAHAWTGGASQARSWSGGAQTAIGGV